MFGILSDRLGWDELSWFGLYFVNFVNFACQMFFPIIRLIALSFLQEIILIWGIFCWYLILFSLFFWSFCWYLLYWTLCLLLYFWCTQSMSFGCLPKQRAKSVYRSRINLLFSSYICLLGWCVLSHCVCQYLPNENSASVWLDWALWRHCLSGELSRCLPLSIS